MRKIFLSLVLFCAGLVFSFAQEKKVVRQDSLEKLLDQTAGFLNKYSYHEGIDEALKLLEASKVVGSDYYHFHAHNFLGLAYTELDDTIRAKKNYEYALEFAEKTKNDTLILWAYNNLGNIYSENPQTVNKGIEMYEKVILLSEETAMPQEGLAPKINIAWTYLDLKKPHKAIPYLKESVNMLKDKEDNYVRSQLYMLLGRYNRAISRPDSAEVYLAEAFKLAEKDSLILPASEIAKEYAALLFEEERYREAYINLSRYEEYKSKIFEKEKLEQVEAANARFDVSEYQKNLEIAKKEQVFQEQIISKSNEKVMVMVISSFVLMIILLILNKINQDRKQLIYQLRSKNRQLQEAKENAERLTRLKTQFFSTVSHELRTPLYGVVGITSLLLEEKGLKKHHNDLKSLKFSADYLLALINDVLQMNKMESNLVSLEHINFNLEELMLSIVKSFEFTRLQNHNKIHCEIDEEIPKTLKGDPVRLSQILMNLVGNAMKFTERGDIYISARLEELKDTKAEICFEVEDNGIGIPPGKQKLIFEEFAQLKSTNYNYQGTGLGLPIVKKLLKLFGSEIHLDSEEGEGAAFSFRILFEIVSTNYSEITKTEALPKDYTGHKKVLIVDDNRINQVVTQRILEKKNFTCEVAASGEEAIKKIREHAYNLVLMDVNMPGISGLEATRKIREFDKNVPVVALTAVEIEEIRNKIFEAGMNDIIVKPYDVQQFYQIVYRNLRLETIKELHP
ncbi:tetratricopeptide repeat-containing hybrid sensor histidine kinase/response regulator [Salegentibacter sediminis]|uniref:tetratricopeptide repeat-containing hybrid sensor histidine kinase/response regulator n=1 Tax=Salegentibacter sediminis TaxID=1930251 RepID=UPI0009BE92F5|nr:response regulator [Salegentibacter sediminis]